MRILLFFFLFISVFSTPSDASGTNPGEAAIRKKTYEFVNYKLSPPKKAKRRYGRSGFGNGVYSMGINIGLAFMQTDLAGTQLGNFGWDDIERAKPIVSVFANCELNRFFSLGAELGYTSYWANDAWIDPKGPNDVAIWRKNRNLSAGSNIFFGNVTLNFTPFSIGLGRYSSIEPFIGVGVGIFTFNPYTQYQGQKVYLKPLQIEDVDYNLWAFSFPFTGGFKFRNDKYSVAIFTGWDVTYTDYVDDISTDDMVFKGKEGLVKELIWRTGEIDPEFVLPERAGRGDPTDYDQLWYFKLQWGFYLNTSGARTKNFGGKKKKGKMKCPKFKQAKRRGFIFL